MHSQLEIIAQSLGRYSRTASGWMAQCPVHQDRNPSLSLSDGEDGKLLVYCFAGCDPRDVLMALRHKGLYDYQPKKTSSLKAKPVKCPSDLPLDWSYNAERIWRLTIPLVGTPAEAYLCGRGCHVPDCEDLRFLPAGVL